MELFQRVLAIAPHTDDVELGAAGTLQLLKAHGAEVRTIALCNAWQSLRPGFPKDTLITEFCAAQKVLGLDSSPDDIFDFPLRNFYSERQAILELFVKISREFRPDLILVPASTDVHQDHQVACQEANRAFKNSTIWGYELPWNNISFQAQAVVVLSEEQVSRKVEAVKAYASQAQRAYLSEEFLRGWMIGRGVTVGYRYAEAFEVIRMVIRPANAAPPG
jgi:N-acetylglucosamine malate deacetylase 1